MRTMYSGPMGISIHALREEGDLVRKPTACGTGRISIHALREEGDRRVARTGGRQKKFLSTPSARRATPSTNAFACFFKISIHALREEGD